MRGAHPVSYAPRARADGWRPPRAQTRVLARLRGSRLDRELADGVAPWCSPLHAARAVQITSERSRTTLARSLETLVEHAEMPHSAFRATAAVEPCREQVREAHPLILALAVRLRSGTPIRARGVARLRILLSDGSGPCYRHTDRHALVAALDAVSRWLDTEE